MKYGGGEEGEGIRECNASNILQSTWPYQSLVTNVMYNGSGHSA